MDENKMKISLTDVKQGTERKRRAEEENERKI
jgi:hypothetical protein